MEESKLDQKTFLCIDCNIYYKPELMEKYPCTVCGNRKCLTKHKADYTCEIYDANGICKNCYVVEIKSIKW